MSENRKQYIVKVGFKKLRQEAKVPTYGTDGAAGADLYAVQREVVGVGERVLVKTGIAIELPLGFEAQVRPRSGLALKRGVTVLNTPGTIDSDYRGEIGVILFNTGVSPFIIEPGDRIAQLVIAPVMRAEFVDAQELSETERAEGGFGSTGTN